MGYAILILFLPLVWPLIAKNIWKTTINWQEMGLNMLIVLAVGGVLFIGAGFSQTYDVETWNGEVTGKEKSWTSCEHDYECPPCTKSCDSEGKNCTETCSTCYDHFNDWDWDVYTNIGNFKIDRIDDQGSDMPPRWKKVQKGQPVALEKGYTNYVQAVPESLYHSRSLESYKDLPPVPAYPKVYDYHKVNRVLPVGVNIPNLQAWNNDLSNILKELGPKKQANVVVIVVNTPDEMYRYKVEAEWLGGNKNDVVVFLGVTDYPSIEWVDVMTFGLNMGNETFHVTLRDALYDIGTMDKERVIPEIRKQVMALYDRPQMKDFEYLKDAITPPLWMLILIFLFEMGLSIGLTVYFHRNEVRFF